MSGEEPLEAIAWFFLRGFGIMRLGMRFERFEIFGHIDRAPVDA